MIELCDRLYRVIFDHFNLFQNLRVNMLTAIHSLLPFHFFPFFSHSTRPNVSFDHLYDLNDLACTLTSNDCDLDQWMKFKKEIKAFIHVHENQLSELDTFLKTLTEWGMEKDPQKTMTFLVDILSVDLITNVVREKEKNSEAPFENIFDWAAEHEPLCPDLPDVSWRTRMYAEWRLCRPLVLYFIPNIINIFLGAFNFLDSQKKYTTLWDKHLLLEIIYKFFIIPFCLIKILQPFFVITAKVYLVTAAIIVATGILVSCYQRWFRPLPDEIVNCTNLDKKMEIGLIEPKVGQFEELERLKAALEVGSNVLLIGKSGDGKTALLHHLIRHKHERQLPEKLQKLAVYEVDCGLMISSVNFGHSELINQIKDQIEGYDDKVLLFFDEFYQIAANPAAFRAFKKKFLEDKPHSNFVAAVTQKEFEEIEKLDMDGSFRRRVVPIIIQSFSDEQNRLVIRELINREAKDIPVTEDAIEAIVELSASEDYLPGIGRPAKTVKLLMDAIGLCRACYSPHYVSVELNEARQEYQGLKLQAIKDVKINPKILKKIRDIKAKIKIFEDKLKKNKIQVSKIKKMIAAQQKLNLDYFRLTHLIARAGAKAGHFSRAKEDIKIRYLWTYFYAIDAMKKNLQNEIGKIRKHVIVQVDKDLIYEVYDEFKAVENLLYGDEVDEYESGDEESDSIELVNEIKNDVIEEELDEDDILEEE
jgi:ATP-dependent Clp protease ATP-binding subunit ClpB